MFRANQHREHSYSLQILKARGECIKWWSVFLAIIRLASLKMVKAKAMKVGRKKVLNVIDSSSDSDFSVDGNRPSPTRQPTPKLNRMTCDVQGDKKTGQSLIFERNNTAKFTEICI